MLLDILRLLGLDESKFSTRLNFIDKNLVNPRNHIAHGEYFDVTLEEYLKLHDDVISLIELFRNEIENASVGRQFVRVDT